MEWPLALVMILGILLALMATGLPVAFCFMMVNLIGVFIFWGGQAGLGQLVLSIMNSVTSFVLVTVPLFILMGEIMFQSGMGFRMIDVLDKWMGRLPGRLALLAVAGGTVFSVMSGASVASVGLLGTILVPEMEKRGYKHQNIWTKRKNWLTIYILLATGLNQSHQRGRRPPLDIAT